VYIVVLDRVNNRSSTSHLTHNHNAVSETTVLVPTIKLTITRKAHKKMTLK